MFDYDEKTYARIALRPHINKNYTKYMRLLFSDFRKTTQHRAVFLWKESKITEPYI